MYMYMSLHTCTYMYIIHVYKLMYMYMYMYVHMVYTGVPVFLISLYGAPLVPKSFQFGTAQFSLILSLTLC